MVVLQSVFWKHRLRKRKKKHHELTHLNVRSLCLPGNPKCVKKLLENGADFKFKDDRKKVPLDYAEMGDSDFADAYSKILDLDYKGVIGILRDAESLNNTGSVVFMRIH